MKIRRIQLSDVPEFLALWARVYEEGAFLMKGPPSEKRALQVVQWVVKQQIPNFVAIDENRLIGAVEVFPGTMCGIGIDEADKRGYLGIQVDSRSRGRGIGRQLMLAAIEDSGRYGFEAIELSVFQSNFAAIKLYEGLGFELTGYEQSVTLPIGLVTRGQKMALLRVYNE